MPERPLNPLSALNAQENLSHAARIAQLPLPTFPRLPHWLAVYDLGDDRLQLGSHTLSYTIALPLFTKVFRAIAHLLDGTREVEQIIKATFDVAEPTTTIFLLKSLYANGIIYEGGETLYPPTQHSENRVAHADFYSNFTPNPLSTIATLGKSMIALVAPNHLAQMFELDLRSIGIERIKVLSSSVPSFPSELEAILRVLDGEAQPLVVVALDSYQRHLFRLINNVCLDRGTRWLHIDGSGPQVTLGPTFVPHQTACYTCFRSRQASHLPFPLSPNGDDEFVTGAQGGECAGTFQPLWRLVFAQAALECARLLTGFTSPMTIGRCHEIGGAAMFATSHDVLKLPRCPSCGVIYAVDESARHPG